MIKIIHIITGLAAGGAETMLYKLVTSMNPNVFEAQVISLSGGGAIADRLIEAGVSVRVVGMLPNVPDPMHLMRLARWIKQEDPDIVQTWMYHADLVGGLATRMAGGKPVLWNIRHSYLDPQTAKKTTRMIALACARLGRALPAEIVCCSETGMMDHIKLGYPAEKFTVIPNGFDLQTFRPDPDARSSVRKELGLDSKVPLIGMVGRFAPSKDHHNFVAAAGKLLRLRTDVKFVLCGEGISTQNEALARWLSEAGVLEHTSLLGRRNDIPRINAALDLATLTSCDEGFPNVLGEAMACGVPCVATDAGDSRFIIGKTGRVVPPRDSDALANAWHELLSISSVERVGLGESARCRIQSCFTLSAITERYERLYQEFAK